MNECKYVVYVRFENGDGLFIGLDGQYRKIPLYTDIGDQEFYLTHTAINATKYTLEQARKVRDHIKYVGEYSQVPAAWNPTFGQAEDVEVDELIITLKEVK